MVWLAVVAVWLAVDHRHEVGRYVVACTYKKPFSEVPSGGRWLAVAMGEVRRGHAALRVATESRTLSSAGAARARPPAFFRFPLITNA